MDIVKFEAVEERIISLRGKEVILDSDLAALYGVQTRDINKAVRNNPDKFPEGYIFELTDSEKAEVVENFHNPDRVRFSPHNPKAFTEKGLYMLATILKSPQATQTTLAIIETFTKLREFVRAGQEIGSTDDEKKQKSLTRRSGQIFSELIENDLKVNETETTVELNLAVVKIKHTVKRK